MKWIKPKRIQIGGIKYKVKYVASDGKYLGEREAGAIDQHSMTIYIDKDAAPAMQLLPLVQLEVMHGINPHTLRARMRKLRIELPRFRS